MPFLPRTPTPEGGRPSDSRSAQSARGAAGAENQRHQAGGSETQRSRGGGQPPAARSTGPKKVKITSETPSAGGSHPPPPLQTVAGPSSSARPAFGQPGFAQFAGPNPLASFPTPSAGVRDFNLRARAADVDITPTPASRTRKEDQLGDARLQNPCVRCLANGRTCHGRPGKKVDEGSCAHCAVARCTCQVAPSLILRLRNEWLASRREGLPKKEVKRGEGLFKAAIRAYDALNKLVKAGKISGEAATAALRAAGEGRGSQSPPARMDRDARVTLERLEDRLRDLEARNARELDRLNRRFDAVTEAKTPANRRRR
ncbi:hypothetical protein V8F20_012850 [Naviculisporaceae sp. PSN 640]